MNLAEIQKNIDMEADRIGKMPMPPLRVKNSLRKRLREFYLRVRHFGGRCYRFALHKLSSAKKRLVRLLKKTG